MYRCNICNAVAPERQKLLRHAVTRTVTPTTPLNVKRTGVEDGRPYVRNELVAMPVGPPREEIAREVPVCRDCHKVLQTRMLQGCSDAEALLRTLREYHAPVPDGYGPPTPEPASAPRPEPVRFAPPTKPMEEFRVSTVIGNLLIAAKSQADAERIAIQDGHMLRNPAPAQAIKFGGP